MGNIGKYTEATSFEELEENLEETTPEVKETPAVEKDETTE